MSDLSHKERKWLNKVIIRASKLIDLQVVFDPVNRNNKSSHRVALFTVEDGYQIKIPYSLSSLSNETLDNCSKQIRRAYRLHAANQ